MDEEKKKGKKKGLCGFHKKSNKKNLSQEILSGVIITLKVALDMNQTRCLLLQWEEGVRLTKIWLSFLRRLPLASRRELFLYPSSSEAPPLFSFFSASYSSSSSSPFE